MLICNLYSSLVKVFSDSEPTAAPLKKISALRGEKISFQLAYYSNGYKWEPLIIDCEGKWKDALTYRRVGNVVVENLGASVFEHAAQQPYERKTPGLYPDVLSPDMELMHVTPGVWHSVWIDLQVPCDAEAGKSELSFVIHNEVEKDAEAYFSFPKVEISVEIIDAELPPQKLKHTEWFYCDCICHAHLVAPWSEAHWELLDRYFADFSAHGINMLLTPVFTPPLDTYVGGERLTTQLVDIKKKGTTYSFCFKRLKRWIQLARKNGIRYFEISHLFTQWGAKCCPKIVANVDGKEEKIFGWHTSATSQEYRDFLAAFLSRLTAFLRREKIADDCYFHISDEPNESCLENYREASAILKPLLKGFKVIDAASHPEFFTEGLVELPVPVESELDKFMDLNLPERWTYYCGGPELPYSNRMHTMPAAANRIMGVLLYLYQQNGFLHWGYNFWNTLVSRRVADPLSLEPDYGYNNGDACLVYPGVDGPLSSVREEVFFEGLQDLRALELLESLQGRERVVSLIREIAGYDLSMNKFPTDAEFLLKLRETVNSGIAEAGKVS